MGKRLYKTYLKEQLRHWRKKLSNADNPYKRKHADIMVETFKVLMEEYHGKQNKRN